MIRAVMDGLPFALLTLLVVSGSVCCGKYEGCRVVRFFPQNIKHLEILKNIEEYAEIFREAAAPGNPMDVMFGPEHHDIFTTLEHIPHTTYVKDVEELIAASQVCHHPNTGSSLIRDGRVDTSRFYNLSEIHTLMDEQAAVCGSDCQIDVIGQSTEGRDLKVMKITRPGSNRRAIWIDGGIHAREWLAPAVASYYIDKLINDYGSDPEVTQMRESFDWYINPVVNPDGYHYTWLDPDNRMWRKTRSPNAGSTCIGTDANRNFDYEWDRGNTDPCALNYRGASPESEPEISSVTSYVLTFSDTVDLFVTLHTYGQILLRPWGFWGFTGEEPADYMELERMATIATTAVNDNSNVTYTFGRTSGSGSGMTMDWAKGRAGVKYSYTLEMRDDGTYMFLAPPSEILPTCIETWAGIVAMATDIAQQP